MTKHEHDLLSGLAIAAGIVFILFVGYWGLFL